MRRSRRWPAPRSRRTCRHTRRRRSRPSRGRRGCRAVVARRSDRTPGRPVPAPDPATAQINGHPACRRATSAPSPNAIPSGSSARRAGRGRVAVTSGASLGRLPRMHLGHHRQVRVRWLRYAEDQRAVLHPPGEPDDVAGVVGWEGRGLIDRAVTSDRERPAEQRPLDRGVGGLGRSTRCRPTQMSS